MSIYMEEALVSKILQFLKTTNLEQKLLKLVNKYQTLEMETISELESQLILLTMDTAKVPWVSGKELAHGEMETNSRLVSRIFKQLQLLLPYPNQLECWQTKQTKL